MNEVIHIRKFFGLFVAAAPAEDIHQMGIEHKKDGDFSKWYQQVIFKKSKRRTR